MPTGWRKVADGVFLYNLVSLMNLLQGKQTCCFLLELYCRPSTFGYGIILKAAFAADK